MGELAQFLFEPWSSGIMQRALIEVVLLGLVGGALGCWIVFYELSYSAESLAHALFPGLVLAALLGFPLILGAGAGVAVAALAILVFGRAPHIGRDTSVAVVISALFGLGVVLALSPDSPPGIQELLFGDVLGVRRADLILAALLAAVVLCSLALFHRQLLAVGFDRATARSIGARPRLTDLALICLLAVATVVAVQGMGNLLVVAILVGPAATARLFCRRMGRMMLLATALSVACGLAGLYLSFYAGLAAGASIAGVVVLLYIVAFAASELAGSRPGRAAGNRP